MTKELDKERPAPKVIPSSNSTKKLLVRIKPSARSLARIRVDTGKTELLDNGPGFVISAEKIEPDLTLEEFKKLDDKLRSQ